MRTPKIKASIFSTYNQINWEVDEIRNIKSFILEKSYDGINFMNIYSVFASKDQYKYS